MNAISNHRFEPKKISFLIEQAQSYILDIVHTLANIT